MVQAIHIGLFWSKSLPKLFQRSPLASIIRFRPIAAWWSHTHTYKLPKQFKSKAYGYIGACHVYIRCLLLVRGCRRPPHANQLARQTNNTNPARPSQPTSSRDKQHQPPTPLAQAANQSNTRPRPPRTTGTGTVTYSYNSRNQSPAYTHALPLVCTNLKTLFAA